MKRALLMLAVLAALVAISPKRAAAQCPQCAPTPTQLLIYPGVPTGACSVIPPILAEDQANGVIYGCQFVSGIGTWVPQTGGSFYSPTVLVNGSSVTTVAQALTALPANGGTIDARGCTSGSLNLGTYDPGAKEVVLLLGACNYTASQIIEEPGEQIIGSGSYDSETVVTVTSSVNGTYVIAPNSGLRDLTSMVFSHFILDVEGTGTGLGCVQINPSQTNTSAIVNRISDMLFASRGGASVGTCIALNGTGATIGGENTVSGVSITNNEFLFNPSSTNDLSITGSVSGVAITANVMDSTGTAINCNSTKAFGIKIDGNSFPASSAPISNTGCLGVDIFANEYNGNNPLPDSGGSGDTLTSPLQGQSIAVGPSPAFTTINASPGLRWGNSGLIVTTGTYAVACDTSTSVLAGDRDSTVVLGNGNTTVNLPDPTATGCTGNFVVSLYNVDTVNHTVNAGGSSHLDVLNGSTSANGVTSFTLGPGQVATVNFNASGTLGVVKIPSSGGSSSAAVYGGGCSGVVISAGNSSVLGLGEPQTSGGCSSAEVDSHGSIVTHACTVKNLQVASSAAGLNSSDGVVTIRTAPAANGTFANSAVTCTIGTGKTCADGTHTASVSAGNMISATVATQSASTLADLLVYVDCQ